MRAVDMCWSDVAQHCLTTPQREGKTGSKHIGPSLLLFGAQQLHEEVHLLLCLLEVPWCPGLANDHLVPGRLLDLGLFLLRHRVLASEPWSAVGMDLMGGAGLPRTHDSSLSQ